MTGQAVVGGAVALVGAPVAGGEPAKGVLQLEASEPGLARAAHGVERKRLKWMAPDVVVAHVVARAALEQAGGSAAIADGARWGVFVGTRMGSQMHDRLAQAIACAAQVEPPSPGLYFDALGTQVSPIHQLMYLSNRVALHLAISLGVHGPVRTFGGSQLASAAALLDAMQALEGGEIDHALVVGVDVALDAVGRALALVSGAEPESPGAAAALVLERDDGQPPRAARLGRILCGAAPTGCAGRWEGEALAERATERALARAGLEPQRPLPSEPPPAGLPIGNARLPAQLLLALARAQTRTRPAADETTLCRLVDRDLCAAAFLVVAS